MVRTGGSWAIRAWVAMDVAGLFSVAPVAPATANVRPPCSYGDAKALVEAFPPLVVVAGDYPPCQYRLFWDGEHVTFQEADWFVGGVVSFWDYQRSGITRAEAIVELEKYTDRLWLSQIGPGGAVGTPVELTLANTGYKNTYRKELGLVVYRHSTVILHLPPGDYLSTLVSSYEGEVYEVDEVTLHVLPAP